MRELGGCGNNCDVDTNPQALKATPGTSLNGGGSRTGIQVWVHPNYTSFTPQRERVDLAIVQMSSPFSLGSGVSIVPLAPANCATCEATGAQYVVSGYGATQSSPTGSTGTVTNLLYARQQFVSWVSLVGAKRGNLSC